jgi:hypothetical protein
MQRPGLAMLQYQLLRFLQLTAVLYTLVAVLYTTNLLLFAPLHTWLSEWLNGRPRLALPTSHLPMVSGSYPGSQTAPEVMYWDSNNFTVGHELKDSRLVSMTENLFLTKAFSQSMRPSNIIPYFYRATGVFHQEDITVTTLITSNRLKVFAELVQRYQGQKKLAVSPAFDTPQIRDRPYICDSSCEKYHVAHPRSSRQFAQTIHLHAAHVDQRRCPSRH